MTTSCLTSVSLFDVEVVLRPLLPTPLLNDPVDLPVGGVTILCLPILLDFRGVLLALDELLILDFTEDTLASSSSTSSKDRFALPSSHLFTCVANLKLHKLSWVLRSVGLKLTIIKVLPSPLKLPC